VYTTWGQKNLSSELLLMQGELAEARDRSSRLEEKNMDLANENAWLRKQLDIQRDSQELLRDIQSRVSEGSLVFDPPPRQHGLCGAVCSLFGRR
jgi:hypothetical protein